MMSYISIEKNNGRKVSVIGYRFKKNMIGL